MYKAAIVQLLLHTADVQYDISAQRCWLALPAGSSMACDLCSPNSKCLKAAVAHQPCWLFLLAASAMPGGAVVLVVVMLPLAGSTVVVVMVLLAGS